MDMIQLQWSLGLEKCDQQLQYLSGLPSTKSSFAPEFSNSILRWFTLVSVPPVCNIAKCNGDGIDDREFCNVTFTVVGMALNCFACWLSVCTKPARIWSWLCVDDFEFLMVGLFHRRCFVQCQASCRASRMLQFCASWAPRPPTPLLQPICIDLPSNIPHHTKCDGVHNVRTVVFDYRLLLAHWFISHGCSMQGPALERSLPLSEVLVPLAMIDLLEPSGPNSTSNPLCFQNLYPHLYLDPARCLRCIWIDCPGVNKPDLHLGQGSWCIHTDHIYAGFYVSWTSTDIGRVQSESISIIASCDCFCLSCGCCGCLYLWIDEVGW